MTVRSRFDGDRSSSMLLGTPGERSAAWAGVLPDRIVPLSVLLLGLVLGILAVPRLVASLGKLPSDPAAVWLQQGKALGPGAYQRVVEERRQATRWIDDPAVWADLGLVQLVVARSEGVSDAEAQRRLTEARTATQRALALAPAQPYTWVSLAYLATVDGDADGAAAALARSFRFGPYIPGLALSRAQLGLANWGALDADLRERVAGEVRRAAREAAPRLVGFAREHGVVDQVRLLLAGRLELLARFDALLDRGKPS